MSKKKKKDYVKATRYPSKWSCLSGVQHQLTLMRNRGREKSNKYSKHKKQREKEKKREKKAKRIPSTFP